MRRLIKQLLSISDKHYIILYQLELVDSELLIIYSLYIGETYTNITWKGRRNSRGKANLATACGP